MLNKLITTLLFVLLGSQAADFIRPDTALAAEQAPALVPLVRTIDYRMWNRASERLTAERQRNYVVVHFRLPAGGALPADIDLDNLEQMLEHCDYLYVLFRDNNNIPHLERENGNLIREQEDGMEIEYNLENNLSENFWQVTYRRGVEVSRVLHIPRVLR